MTESYVTNICLNLVLISYLQLTVLDTCIYRVGQGRSDATRDVLINGLAAILATSGRESSLPLRHGARPEMANQAESIGTALVGYVRESLDYENANANFSMSSHCDGHLWTREVVGELMGSRGDSVVMQLYNEWSHRIVLLRNALMPFENWDEVPIVVVEGSKGMRMLEAPSNEFISHVLSGRLPQKAVVNMVKALTAPSLPPGGFGFQYSQGTVLPAFLNGSPSRSLLRYYPNREPSLASEVLFEYQHSSYEQAERSELTLDTIKSSPDAVHSTTDTSELKSRPIPGSKGTRAYLQVEVELRGHPEALFPVCLGQIARGWRYASRVPKGNNIRSSDPGHTVFHKAEDALALPGLVFSASQKEQHDDNLHVFPISDPLLGFALFGKLYPGNVVALSGIDDFASTLQVGRGFGTKFVHWQRD